MKYTKDENKKNILIDTSFNDYQVMMEWEKPYMEALIERLNPSGDVLEIGFGLGYSADAIQKYNISSHTIIENDPQVLEKAYQWAEKQKYQVNIIEGTWQNRLRDLTKFDSIFFDDSPTIEHPDENDERLYVFYYSILKNHVNENSRFSWYCDFPIYWVSHPATSWSNRKISIDIPTNARYVEPSQITKKELYLPLVEFPYGSSPEVTPVIFNKFLEFSLKNNINYK